MLEIELVYHQSMLFIRYTNYISNATKIESSVIGLSREILADLWTLRERFVATRFIWIPGAHMAKICRGLGATEEDFESIGTVSDTLKTDPTLPFRRTVPSLQKWPFIYDFDCE